MGMVKSEKEQIFLQSRDTIQEVSGWKMFLFLPQNIFWQFFILFVIIFKCIYNFTRAIYLKNPYFFKLADRLCDIIYSVDVFLSTMHFIMKKTRKLKHGKRRPLVCLLVDYISLIPLEGLYDNTLYGEHEKSNKISYSLNLIGVLRIYQVPMIFSNMKDSIYKVKTYLILTIFQVFIYMLLITHFLSCFLFLLFNEDQRIECLNNFFTCVLGNVMATYFFLGQTYLSLYKNYNITQSNTYIGLVAFEFFLGYLIIYGFICPLFLFVCIKFLSKYFEFATKMKRIGKMMESTVESIKLKKRILNYFKELGSFGRCDKHPEILEIFPTCFRKRIFCDMHWEAMKHSYLLQDISIGCKRSMALHMKTEFILPKTKLFEKNENATIFLYLESGLIQLMAEENTETPVLSLSGGTVLGEISFFLSRNCHATVRAEKYSIIHTLTLRDFFNVLMDYPSDKKMIIRKVRDRINLAKSMHEIKTNVCSHFEVDADSNKSSEKTKTGNIKWIKSQYRAISQLKDSEKLLNLRQYTIDDYERQIQKLNTQMKHTSVNLPYLTINDEKLHKYGVVCLKKFPWLMDPQCEFVSVWKGIILLTATFTIVFYPAHIAWYPFIPNWFFCASCVISLMYIIDIYLKFITSIRIKNVTIHKFSSLFIIRLTRISLCADIIAALPLQIVRYNNQLLTKPFIPNLFYLNALVKCYMLIPLINKLNYTSRALVFARTLTKYMLVVLLMIYLAASVFYLTGIKCVIYECGGGDWFPTMEKDKGKLDPIFSSIFRAIYLGYEIPDEDYQTDVLTSYYIFFILYFIFHNFFFALKGECTASYVLQYTDDVEFKRRMDFIYHFMGKHKIIGQVRNRVLSTMMLQRVNYVTEKYTVWENIPENLKIQIERSYILPVVSKCRLFEFENERVLMSVCRRFEILTVPKNSLLCTLGTQTTRLYVIQKGFVQINSFIVGDLYLNTSRAIRVAESDAFPVIDVLSQIPVSVTAVTVTDCELLVIELEDLISELIIHGIFKDYVEAIKETNLSKLTTAKLGMSEFKDIFSQDDPYEVVFHRLKGLGKVLKCLLKRKAINSHSTCYLYWELSRVMFILLHLIAWPIAMGYCTATRTQQILFKTLIITEVLTFIDVYVRMHVAYYNKLGIYISHTLSTAEHYLATAFIADFIAFSPNFHLIYVSINEEYGFHWYVILIHITLRSFSLYRIIGFISFLKFGGKVVYKTKTVLMTFFIALCVHYYICITVHLYICNGEEPKFRLTLDNSLKLDMPWKYYINELGLLLALGMRSVLFISSYDVTTAVINLLAGSLGIIGQVWLYSHLTLSSTTANNTLTSYQYYLESFINFLSRQKAEEKIINQAVEHYEHEWQKHLGYDLYAILSSLPESLHEDVAYPLYKAALSGVTCLSKANEYFYRTLSRNIREVYLKEGYVVTFQKEVQSNIYFIFSGQCSIENSAQILCKGSMFGDIKGTGIMNNKIMARTNVRLLKISSQIFFLTLNNFYRTKMAYQSQIDHSEDFIASVFFENYELTGLTQEKEKAECEFLPFIDAQEEKEYNSRKKKFRFYMRYDSKAAQCFRLVFMLSAYLTVIVIPLFMVTRLVSPWVLSIIYLLDLIWIVKIFMRSKIVNTEDNPTTGRKKFKRCKLIFIIMFHIFSAFPFEIIPLVYCGLPMSDYCCFSMCLCYANRLLRMFYIFNYFKKKGKNLLINFFMNVIGIVMLQIAVINTYTAIILELYMRDDFRIYTCYHSFSTVQINDLILSYVCSVNNFIGGGMKVCLPEDEFEVFFQLCISLLSLLLKAYFINHVLMILYVTHHNKSNQMVELEQMDNYLSARDVSPHLRSETEKYFSNLLNSFYEGADTYFLRSAPSSIKTDIMQNIYLAHLNNCFLFRDIDEDFLKQLTTRLTLRIFFPGDYIAEKGDVDHNIFFIQEGEVYCIQNDRNYKALEIATDVYTTGASFGAHQGIFPASQHTMTYRAKTLSNIVVLNYSKWEDLRNAFPDIFQIIYKRCIQSSQ